MVNGRMVARHDIARLRLRPRGDYDTAAASYSYNSSSFRVAHFHARLQPAPIYYILYTIYILTARTLIHKE